MRCDQITCVHYQAISHIKNKILLLFIDLKNFLEKQKLITEIQKARQAMWLKLIQTDREGRNICFDSLMASH